MRGWREHIFTAQKDQQTFFRHIYNTNPELRHGKQRCVILTIRNESKTKMIKVSVAAFTKWQTVVHLRLLKFDVGVSEKSHPLWLNKHCLWSWISFLSIYTMRRSFDIPIRITANKPWNVLCSPATPRYTPMGWFNYLHSWVLLWKKMCWFNQDTAVISKRDQKGMLNGRVHILFLDFPEDADIVTGSFFFFFFFTAWKSQ